MNLQKMSIPIYIANIIQKTILCPALPVYCQGAASAGEEGAGMSEAQALAACEPTVLWRRQTILAVCAVTVLLCAGFLLFQFQQFYFQTFLYN
jgi:hypothetical protein